MSFNQSIYILRIIDLYLIGEKKPIYHGTVLNLDENIKIKESYSNINMTNTVDMLIDYKNDLYINKTLIFYSDFQDNIFTNDFVDFIEENIYNWNNIFYKKTSVKAKLSS